MREGVQVQSFLQIELSLFLFFFSLSFSFSLQLELPLAFAPSYMRSSLPSFSFSRFRALIHPLLPPLLFLPSPSRFLFLFFLLLLVSFFFSAGVNRT